MTGYFAIRMFPAAEGDCFVLEYGDERRPSRILIDGGRMATYRNHLSPFLQSLPPPEKHFELFVVTHIDRDHIEGALELLRDRQLTVTFRDVWFNDYWNLLSDDPPRTDLGARAGEEFTARILRRGWKRNAAFAGGAISTRTAGIPIRKAIDDDLVVTVLSPDRAHLERLEPQWEDECRKAGIEPGSYDLEPEPRPVLGSDQIERPDLLASRETRVDRAAPNGTSIALLIEYDRRRVLLAADAHPDLLVAALRTLGYGPNNPLSLDAFKLAHHGSKANTTRELLECVRCSRFLISTNGSLFNHPDPEGIARVVTAPGADKTLYFNYRCQRSELWDRPDWKSAYNYNTYYGDARNPVLVKIARGYG